MTSFLNLLSSLKASISRLETSVILFAIDKDFQSEMMLDDLKKIHKDKLKVIIEDALDYPIWSLGDEPRQVIANLPYNTGTKMLILWLKHINHFAMMTLMFQKEVADRIVAGSNNSKYGRLSILTNWKLNVKKIIDIKPQSFSPRPKIDSSLLLFTPKENSFELKDAKNLEMITRVFFSQRRKMLKKPFNQIFNGNTDLLNKFNLDLNLRPQNLDFDTYYKLTIEYEKLRS